MIWQRVIMNADLDEYRTRKEDESDQFKSGRIHFFLFHLLVHFQIMLSHTCVVNQYIFYVPSIRIQGELTI